MKVSLSVGGFESVRGLLRDLGESVSDRVLLEGLKDAAAPLVLDLVQSAPRSFAAGPRGHAADSIKVWQVDKELKGAHVAVAPADWAFYLHFREFGTVHQEPEPFFRPAIMRHAGEIEERFADYVGTRVSEIIEQRVGSR